MLSDAERAAIERLWARKLDQDERGLPQSARHRNLEPVSAELVHALAIGLGARRLVEVGGSSGLSTVALASAARQVGGQLVSIELEPSRQAEARATLAGLDLLSRVQLVLGDAAGVLPRLEPADLILLDCEKEDYVRFYGLAQLEPGALVVADNILSHDLTDYVTHVRARSGVESITLAVGKGLEITRVP